MHFLMVKFIRNGEMKGIPGNRIDFVHIFRSHQKSQVHEILALGLIWASLKHDEARFFSG